MSEIDWYKNKSMASTMEKAAKLKLPIMFEFYTEWCPYCARLDETVFKDPDVIRVSKNFLCVKIDGDLGSADHLMSEYKVKGYPTIIFTRPDGEPVGAWQDLADAGKFAAHMGEILAAKDIHPSWEVYSKDELPTEVLISDKYFEEAEKLEDAGKADAAKEVYHRGGLELMARLQGEKEMREEKSLVASTIILLTKGGAVDKAVKFAEKAVKVFPDNFIYYYRLALALKEKGDVKGAVKSAVKSFKKAYGRNRLRVADLLSELLVGEKRYGEAKKVITEALGGVDWTTNTRKTELKYKENLENRLAGIPKKGA